MCIRDSSKHECGFQHCCDKIISSFIVRVTYCVMLLLLFYDRLLVVVGHVLAAHSAVKHRYLKLNKLLKNVGVYFYVCSQ